MKVYIVICYWGEYSDYTEVIEKTFKSKLAAMAYILSKMGDGHSYKIEESEMDE